MAYYKLTVMHNCQGPTLYAVKDRGGTMTQIRDQVRLERHRCLLKGLYIG